MRVDSGWEDSFLGQNAPTKKGGCPKQLLFHVHCNAANENSGKGLYEPVLVVFRFLVFFMILFDLKGVQEIPPDFCVLGNTQFLEPAEQELAEPAIVTEPLEPEPA